MDVKLLKKLYGEHFAAYECSADEMLSFTHFTPELACLLGYSMEECESISNLWQLVSEDELEFRKTILLEQLEDGDVEILLPLTKGDGTIGWFLNRGVKTGDTVTGILVSVGRIKGLFDRQSVKLNAYKTRLQQTKSMVDSLQVQAEQDSLTKLYNADTTRRLCSEYLSESDRTCAIIMLDLDAFKQVNDVLGHIEGDRVLTQVAETVRKLFRADDIIGRIGGDEFLILMKDIPSAAIVRNKCATIVSSIYELIDRSKCPHFGISAGAVVTPTGPDVDYDEIYKSADREMYCVKNTGGNNYRVVETL